jgi:hypothetical protein
MVKRSLPPLPPGIKETLERLAAALWYAGVCLLLYLTLQAQLARAAEFPQAQRIYDARGHAVNLPRVPVYGGGDGFDTSSGDGGSNPARSRNVAAADRYVAVNRNARVVDRIGDCAYCGRGAAILGAVARAPLNAVRRFVQ